MKLTNSNYYTLKNRYLSNSKIGDWLKSKEYFYGRHVTGDIVKKETDALIIGKACDLWLTKSRKAFEKDYIKVARRTKLEGGPIQLTTGQYEEVVAICEAVEREPVYKSFKKGKKQLILQMDKKIGMFEGLCGIPDSVLINKEGKSAIIFDLKTARNIEPRKYYYHAKEYGYFRQQAMYQMLLAHNYGIEKFESYHLVVEKDVDNINKVGIYLLDQVEIDKEMKFLMAVIEDISKEKKFKDKPVTMDDAILLKDPNSFVESEEEGEVW